MNAIAPGQNVNLKMETPSEYLACVSALQAGKQPVILKQTQDGDMVCRVLYQVPEGLVAEVCIEDLQPEVLARLGVLLGMSMETGLTLVMLIYPQGGYTLTFRQIYRFSES